MPFLDINVGTSGRTEYNPWTQKCIRRKSSTKRAKSKPRVSFAVEVPTTDWGCPPVRPATPLHPRSPSRNMLQRAPNDPYNNLGYVGDGRLHQGIAHDVYDPPRRHAQPAQQYEQRGIIPAPQYQRPMNTPAPLYAPAAPFPPPRYDEFGRPYQDMEDLPAVGQPMSTPAYHGTTKPIYIHHDDRRRTSLPDLAYEPRYRVSPSAVDDCHSNLEIYSRGLPRGGTLSRTPLPSRPPPWQEHEYKQRHKTRPRSRSRSRHVYARAPREDHVNFTRPRSTPRSTCPRSRLEALRR